jgi:hypothetical protein
VQMCHDQRIKFAFVCFRQRFHAWTDGHTEFLDQSDIANASNDLKWLSHHFQNISRSIEYSDLLASHAQMCYDPGWAHGSVVVILTGISRREIDNNFPCMNFGLFIFFSCSLLRIPIWYS